jgi:hypothetical protein
MNPDSFLEDDAKIWHYVVMFLAIVGIQAMMVKYTHSGSVDIQETGSEAGAALLVSA